MREGLRGTGRRKPALADRPLQGRRYRYLHPRVPQLRGAAARGGLTIRSHLTQRVARARAILIAGAIAVAVLALASPATARAAASASPVTTCADQNLLHGSYGDVTVTPGHWCAIGFSTVTGNIYVTGATSLRDSAFTR